MPTDANTKHGIRERIWSRLAQAQASHDFHGRIPDFVGAAAAAARLAELPAWGRAQVIKTNPDQPPLPVRGLALRQGKLVYMAVPKLADPLPFFRLDPAELGDDAEALAAHRVATSRAPKTAVADMRPVDLIICGTAAANRQGVRIGKGAGYSDIEVGLLVTPEEMISCGPAYRPRALVWPSLSAEQIAAIPVLAAMADRYER